MLELAQWQSAMADALLTGRFDPLAGQPLDGPVAAEEAFSIHRNTALHGLVHALRLSCPTVDLLTGAAFFDQAALAYVQACPPRSPWLTGYGAGFPEFLATYSPAADLAYLPDVARLDLAIETAAHQALGRDGPRLDLGEAVMTLDASVRVLRLDWPAPAIRDAVEAGDEALARLDLRSAPQALALWRRPEGAGLQPLSPLSADFLSALLDGGDVEAVLAGAADPSVIRLDFFAAPFTRLTLS